MYRVSHATKIAISLEIMIFRLFFYTEYGDNNTHIFDFTIFDFVTTIFHKKK